jgi:hypothetical protein
MAIVKSFVGQGYAGWKIKARRECMTGRVYAKPSYEIPDRGMKMNGMTD